MNAMNIPLGRMLIAATLVVSGAFSWALSGVAADLANERERAATLQHDGASRTPTDSWLGRFWTLLDPEAGRHAAIKHYWRRDFDSVARLEARSDDVAGQRLAANATYRRAQALGSRPMSVEQIDQALQAYASVLRNGFDRDAAYNYEFLARQRDLAARARHGAKPTPRAMRPIPPSTIHGRQGTDPPSTKGEEFEVLTPMDYGDREAQPEAAPGRKLPRKG
jgi:hypothetical protein